MLKLTNLAFSGSRAYLGTTRSVGTVSPFVKNQSRFLSTINNTNRFQIQNAQPFLRDRFQTPITTSFKYNFKNSQNNFHQSRSTESSTNHSETLRSLLVALGAATATGALYAYGNTFAAGPLMSENTENSDDDNGEPPQGFFTEYWQAFKVHFSEIWSTAVWVFNLFRGYDDHGDPDKILPNALPEPYGRSYTMLIDVHLLVHLEYKGTGGWVVTKRPGTDYFLQYMSRFYELCVIQSTSFPLGTAVLDKLDPTKGIISYRVYQHLIDRSPTGKLKQLEKFNRPLEKLIFLDVTAKGVDSPDNVLVVPEWDGATQDTSLLDLIVFLQELAIRNVKDVRPFIKAVDGKQVIEGFRKQREEAAQQAQRETAQTKKGTIWSKLK